MRKIILGMCIFLMLFAMTGCDDGGGGASKPKKTIAGIAVDGVKTEFNLGEDFSTGNYSVTVTWSDAKTETLAAADITGLTVDSSAYNKNAVNTYPIIVQYQGKSATYYVSVIDPETTTAAPQISPQSGVFGVGANITVTLSCATTGAEIWYTVNGGDPVPGSSTQYSGSFNITLTETTTIKSRAFAAGKDASAVMTAVYTVTEAKTVSVGAQSWDLLEGEADEIDFPVSTTNIAAGSWDVTVDGLPTGVTVADTVTINASGAGTLTLAIADTAVAGTTTLTLTIDSATSAAFSLKIDARIAVTSITLNKTTLTLPKGGSEQLIATVLPSNATNRDVTWTSSRTNQATVDEDGNVTVLTTATSDQQVIITVRSVSNTGVSATCTVTVAGDIADSFTEGGYYYKNIAGTMNVKVTNKMYTDSVWVTGVENSYSGELTVPSMVTHDGVTYNVTAIGFGAFYMCENLTKITLPASIKEVETYAFCGCTTLASVNLSEGLTTLNTYAFAGCSELTSLTLPASLSTMSYGIFGGCRKLTLSLATGNTYLSLIDGVLYTRSGSNPNYSLVWLPENYTGAYIMPDSVSHYVMLSMNEIPGLTAITFPASITAIDASNNFRGDGDTAFKSLTSITFKSATPPTVAGTNLNAYVSQITIYVPAGSLAAYQASYWDNFTLVEAPYSAIGASALASFGSLATPYTQPATQTVTVTNTGNQSVTLIQPTASANYTIGALSATTLAAKSATATFTVQPKAGLPVGSYNETITINTSTSGISATVQARFTVRAAGSPDKAVDEKYQFSGDGEWWINNWGTKVEGAVSSMGVDTFTVSGGSVNISYNGLYTEGGGIYDDGYGWGHEWDYLYNSSGKIGIVLFFEDDGIEVYIGKTTCDSNFWYTELGLDTTGMQNTHNGNAWIGLY